MPNFGNISPNRWTTVSGFFNLVLWMLWASQPLAEQKQDGQLKHTYSSSVRIWDVALKTCQRQWMIGRSGERGSGISVLTARHDDDDDDHCICGCGLEISKVNLVNENDGTSNSSIDIVSRFLFWHITGA